MPPKYLVPFMPEMLDRFQPGDWRFLGSPIDFIVFDGLTSAPTLLTQIVLVEVKTNATQSKKQAAIKASIDAGAVPLTCEIYGSDSGGETSNSHGCSLST